MNVEAVGKTQNISFFNIWFNCIVINYFLELVGEKYHDNICHFCSFICTVNFKTFAFCCFPGLASFKFAYNYIHPAFTKILCMCMTLASLTYYGYFLAIKDIHIDILVVINLCHFSSLNDSIISNNIDFYKINFT